MAGRLMVHENSTGKEDLDFGSADRWTWCSISCCSRSTCHRSIGVLLSGGNEDPADIIRLDDLLIEGADLAIASRFAVGAINEESDFLRPRARVNQVLTWIANRVFNQESYVTDTINGFRALRREDLLSLNTTVKRFPIEYQILYVRCVMLEDT